MKKILLRSIFALVLLATVGYGVNKNMNSDGNLSDLALSNIEALAQGGETGEGGTLPDLIITCSATLEGRCWHSDWEPRPFGRYKVTCDYFSGLFKDNCMPGIYPI